MFSPVAALGKLAGGEPLNPLMSAAQITLCLTGLHFVVDLVQEKKNGVPPTQPSIPGNIAIPLTSKLWIRIRWSRRLYQNI